MKFLPVFVFVHCSHCIHCSHRSFYPLIFRRIPSASCVTLARKFPDAQDRVLTVKTIVLSAHLPPISFTRETMVRFLWAFAKEAATQIPIAARACIVSNERKKTRCLAVMVKEPVAKTTAFPIPGDIELHLESRER